MLVDALLTGGSDTLVALREQFAEATLARRESYNSGVEVLFNIPDSTPSVSPPEMQIGDLQLRIVGHDSPADAMLFIKKGKLESLEYYSCAGERWPKEPALVAAYY